MRTPLPEPPVLSSDEGLVLAPYIGNAHVMYFQTHHERPMMGGYLSRPPPFALRAYAETPGVAWFFHAEPRPRFDGPAVIEGLRAAGVRDVLLAPDDPRVELLERHGFRRHWRGGSGVVFAVP